jgi:hypothetical protein
MLRFTLVLIILIVLPQSVSSQCDAPTGTLVPYSGSSLSMPMLISGGVNITGDLEIEDFTEFVSADVMVDAGFSIIVRPGHTLRIDMSYFTSDGQGMWDGIIVDPGGILQIAGTTICHAIIGVDSRGTGLDVGFFDIGKSLFYNNQIGVRIKNYNAVGMAHPGLFRGTTIEGGPLLADASTTFSVIGIQIKNVNNGVQGFELAGGAGNIFRSLDIGLDISNSIVLMYGNRFEDCQDINGLGLGYGVRSSATEIGSDLFIQSTINYNEFDGCLFGIATNGLRDIDILGTTMTNVLGLHRIGIRVQNTIPGGTISISDNTIEQFKNEGIRLDDNSGTVALPIVVNIEGNEISTATTSIAVRTGIYIEEPTAGSNLNLSVTNENIISGIQVGIYATNVFEANIEDNDVTFNLPTGSSDDAIGIYCVRCEGAEVRGNVILGSCMAPCTYNTTNIRIRGIAMNNCLNATLITNSV